MKQFLEDELLKEIPFHWGVFGGAVRDTLCNIKPKDIDVAVDCSREALNILLKDIPSKKNRFGGHKFSLNGTEYDLWPLRETWQLKKLSRPATFFSLAATAPFNADCIVYSSRDGLVDFGWYTTKELGELRINSWLNPHHMFNAMRGVKTCMKYSLKPGECFVRYTKEHLLTKIDDASKRYSSQFGRNLEEDLRELKLC